MQRDTDLHSSGTIGDLYHGYLLRVLVSLSYTADSAGLIYSTSIEGSTCTGATNVVQPAPQACTCTKTSCTTAYTSSATAPTFPGKTTLVKLYTSDATCSGTVSFYGYTSGTTCTPTSCLAITSGDSKFYGIATCPGTSAATSLRGQHSLRHALAAALTLALLLAAVV